MKRLLRMFRHAARPSSVLGDSAAKESRVATQVYQIFYSDETAAMLDPRFTPLDNTSNPRPDWREYFPIRQFLLRTPLDEQSFYGFLSPKFRQKVFLDGEDVLRFVSDNRGADVVSFSPGYDLQALFLNTFLHGDFALPGLLSCAERFLAEAGVPTDLKALVMDSSNSIFCNYFVAKPKFWRAWLDLTEKLFALAEAPSALYEELNAPTTYNGVPLKVFILERLASFLLATDSRWVAKPYNPFRISRSDVEPYCNHYEVAVICDALKTAYRQRPFPEYLKRYDELLATRVVVQGVDGAGEMTA